jgi:NAD(P)-dependent dehydrogenase (short-subunit alcohol dehydrogenase family)
MSTPARAQNGAVTLITGAASGIGAALCRRIAAPGQSLVLHTRKNREGLERVRAAAADAGAAAHLVLGDLGDPSVAGRIVDETLAKFGRLDHLVSNAGFADKRPFGTLDEAGLTASISAITGAFFRLVTAALPALRKSPSGRVVAVSSFAAHVFRGDIFPASAAAKAGLEGLAKSLAAQLAPSGITVNCVVPGYTQKDSGAHAALGADAWKRAAERVPMGRLGTPADAAALVAFLLSADAGYVTGQTIHVDGGLTL